jgi:hypothetical protein
MYNYFYINISDYSEDFFNHSFDRACAKKELFWGYEMQGGIYIAKSEKVFLDLVYLASRGDDIVRCNRKGLSPHFISPYPQRLYLYPFQGQNIQQAIFLTDA